ncbi:MAG: NlpC/P60 family protein [Cypionkella sp.]|uniref:NlpC/P60 family protein n=1 Tax=Cypionkella sp. TaxID=2811411 RepID=UPI002ABC9131|nr:NlpC/P60 family protein [Cypionkella sp.]MDZ4310611.1 NlpC/P60 family protein [Cypionkella sp.]
MSWSNRYIGIPFADLGRTREGVDCYGLACVIYAAELGIALPDYVGSYASATERAEISALMHGAAGSWRAVTGKAAPYDLAVFRRGRFTTHVGIVIRHGFMIHMDAEDAAKVGDYRTGVWSSRFAGHYRHHSRTVEGGLQ